MSRLWGKIIITKGEQCGIKIERTLTRLWQFIREMFICSSYHKDANVKKLEQRSFAPLKNTRGFSEERSHNSFPPSLFDKIRLPMLKLTIHTRLKRRQKYSMCSTSGIFPLLHLIPFYFRTQCMCEYRQTLGLMSIRSGLWPSGVWVNVRKAVLR